MRQTGVGMGMRGMTLTMNDFAMWLGYAVMAVAALASVGFAAGLACNYVYRKILQDLPSVLYVSDAVQAYRKQVPPAKWNKEPT